MRLKNVIVGTQTIFEQKDGIGFDPMASTAFLAGERLKVWPEKYGMGIKKNENIRWKKAFDNDKRYSLRI